MMTDEHRFAALMRFFQIDAVSQYLRAESSKGTECANSDLIGTIDDMTACNGGMPFNDQVRLAPRVQIKMAALGSTGKPGDPVACADATVLVELEQFEPFADCERSYIGLRAHFQARRHYKRESGDEGGLVYLESAKNLQHKTPHTPREGRGACNCEHR